MKALPANCLVTTLFIVVILSTFTVGCSRKRGSALEELSVLPAPEESYAAQSGDALFVKVWGEPQLSGEVLVRDDGKFTMPLIQDVPAGGRSLEAVSEEVSSRLQSFVPSASVSISIVQSAPVRYYLSGAFLRPGEYKSASRVSFLQAVASGGGFSPFADDSAITLVRQTGEGEKRYVLDYGDVISGKQPNPPLRSGDVIAVE
jgi:polysaccharide export outer membrane protein